MPVKLAPEGFSIHTIELKIAVTFYEFDEYVKKLFTIAKNDRKIKFYKLPRQVKGDSNSSFFCALPYYGVRIILSKNNINGFSKCYISAIINVRRLVDPNCTYAGILLVENSTIDKTSDAFCEAMRSVGLPELLDDWDLFRVDLCANLYIEDHNYAEELLRLLRRDIKKRKIYRSSFSETLNSAEDKQRQRLKNAASIRFENRTYAVTIYNKRLQLLYEGLNSTNDDDEADIIRIEVACKRRKIKSDESTTVTKETVSLLDFYLKNSRQILMNTINKNFCGGVACKIEELREEISNSRYNCNTRKELIWLVEYLQHYCFQNKLEKEAEQQGINKRKLKKRIEQLQRLGLCPVPLRKSFYLDKTPTLPLLLENVYSDQTIKPFASEYESSNEKGR